MSAPLLRASGISHAFGAVPVLEEVDIELWPGRLLIVLGPNGSGKTTLVRIACGVLAPHAGRVELGGRALGGLTRRAIARVLAVVPQETPMPFAYGVRELVAMGRAPHLGALGREQSDDRRAVEQALAELGLAELADRAFPTLSGGEKQRVILARAVAQQTRCLLLDEPTAQMDLGRRMQTFAWLRGWIAAAPTERGAVLVTHDLVLAARYADEIVLLAGGRVQGRGEPARVLSAERIAAVYGVEAEVHTDSQLGLVITPLRATGATGTIAGTGAMDGPTC